LDEIKENDYNLNVSLYVMPVEEEEKIDVAKEYSELKELEKEKREIGNKLERYVSEIAKVIGG